jgi:hypothetical protein
MAEFLVLDSPLTALLEEMQNDPKCLGITIYPSPDGQWQVSGNFRNRQNWNCVMCDDIASGLATLHQREKLARAGMRISPQYVAG